MFRKFMNLFNVFILTAVSLIGVLILPTASHACSCAVSPEPQVELQNKTAVFSGRVIAINEPSKLLKWSSADPVKVTFEVDKVWKGEVGKKAAVHTAMSGESCGFEFEANQEYLVYALGEASDLEVSLCSRTQTMQTSASDIQVLGTALKSTMDELSEEGYMPENNAKYYIIAVGALVGVILLLVILVKRKKLRN